MIVNWDPLLRILVRPVLGRLILVSASTLIFGALAFLLTYGLSLVFQPIPQWKILFATFGFAAMGFVYGIYYFVIRR
jgi:hypothetical protein